MICVLGTYLTVSSLPMVLLYLRFPILHTRPQVSRIWWALARDNATPFAGVFSSVNEKLSCPVPATLLAGKCTSFAIPPN